MKKYVFILIAFVFAAVGCSKEEIDQSQKETTEATQEFAQEAGDDCCGYMAQQDCRIPCWPGTVCGCYVLDPIVIRPNQIAQINGAIAQGPGAIGVLFNDPSYEDMLIGLDPASIVSMQSGLYNMAVFDEDQDMICFRVGQHLVLDETNAEFSIRFNK